MASLVHVATLSSVPWVFLSAISDLEILGLPGTLQLQSSSGALGGVTTFGLDPGGTADFVAQTPYSTFSKSFTPLVYDGATLLIPIARLEQVLATCDTGPQGSASSTPVFLKNTGFSGDKLTMLAVDLDGETFFYTGINGESGLFGCKLTGTSGLSSTGEMADSAANYLGDVSALASCRINSNPMLFSASATENGITSFRILANGSLVRADSLGAAQDLFITTPTAIKTVQVGGSTYLLVASSGSSSLSVLKIDAAGGMQVVDHILDSLDTSFAGATAMETVTFGDRVFVIVAGSDDGISLFTLLPGGRLLHLGSLADTATTTLNNVSALAAAVVGAAIQVFAASQNENGISQFTYELAQIGQTLAGTMAANTIVGTAKDDVLVGYAGNDTLDGGGGNDILLDGSGNDRMTGGAGADIHVLTYDGMTDTIMDFQVGVDRLDLSAFPMFYSAGQMRIEPTATGARLIFGTEVIEVISATRSPLTIANFATATVLNLSRPAGSLDGPGLTLRGTASSDIMFGANGDDLVFGSGGADWIVGGSGRDTVQFIGTIVGVVVDLNHPDRNSGQASGDGYESIEVFRGTAQVDGFYGNIRGNVFFGGDGADQLQGRRGGDQLDGGLGQDRIGGGRGADTLTGGVGNDTFVFEKLRHSLMTANGYDLIRDFAVAEDQISLELIDANRSNDGNQAFRFIGAAQFSGAAGELRVVQDLGLGSTYVRGDVNGDGIADFQIELTGMLVLNAGDFLL